MIVSLDIETTGLDHNYCQMIEVGAVLEDFVSPLESLPIFHSYILRDKYIGEPYALSMHAEIFRRIAAREKGYSYLESSVAMQKFAEWLKKHNVITPENNYSVTFAGKNFSRFDFRFLEDDGWNRSVYFKIHHRSFDVGNLYFDPKIDKIIPSTEECMKKAGIEGNVKHTALEDAMLAVKLMRNYYKGINAHIAQ